MLRRVFVRRTITAADMTADLAQTQMQPASADLQAILTAVCAGRDRHHLRQV